MLGTDDHVMMNLLNSTSTTSLTLASRGADDSSDDIGIMGYIVMRKFICFNWSSENVTHCALQVDKDHEKYSDKMKSPAVYRSS